MLIKLITETKTDKAHTLPGASLLGTKETQKWPRALSPTPRKV